MSSTFHTRKFVTPQERAEAAALPPAERQWMIDNLLFAYPMFSTVSGEIRLFHNPVDGGTHGTGLVGGLLGTPRSGKSYICQHYWRQHPPRADEGGESYPVVYLEARNDWTPYHCAEQIFMATGAKSVPSLKTPALITASLKRLVQSATQLVILDDAHFILLESKGKALRDYRSIIKGIADLNTCNLLVSGLPGLQTFLEDDAQIAGRGDFPHWEVRALDWSLMEEREQFVLLMHGIDQRLPFRELSNLASPENLADFYRVSDGKIGRVMNIVKDAGKRAINADSSRILPEHLQAASQLRLKVGQTYVGFGYEAGGRA